MKTNTPATPYKSENRRFCCSDTNILLLTSDFGSSTRGERQFFRVFRNHTMLTIPQHSAHLVVQSQFFNIMFGPNFSQSWLDPNFNCLPQWQTTQLSVYMARNQLPTDLFSKSSNSQDHRFRAWRHSHSSSISYRGFIMTIVIVISFALERKTVSNVCAPELKAE